MSRAPIIPAEIEYPESDGKPMAETDVHRQVMINLIEGLDEHFRSAPNVYVSGNILLYYVEGDPTRSVAPDVLVTKGIPKGQRRIYRVWVEGKAPDVIIEVTSRSTRREDLQTKRALYSRLRVSEYFLYDPLGEYLRPRLQGYRLAGESYERIESSSGALLSMVLGLELRLEPSGLRLVDPATGQRLLSYGEIHAARQAAEEQAAAEAQARRTAKKQAEAEAQARRVAEERVAQVEAELARLRAELERRENAG
ncbi:MAG: Uma2 family endonuclease [Chloroflexi bacterium]|nr:Uma2 family endonuclease [Chloroflexota bacterium]